jgi:hypothetical protein
LRFEPLDYYDKPCRAEVWRRQESLHPFLGWCFGTNRILECGGIETEFGLPKPLAEEYSGITSFFSQLRDLRDAVVHGGTGVGEIYITEQGFCINPKRRPFSSFDGWRPEHYYNENIASVLPWIANVILRTIQNV